MKTRLPFVAILALLLQLMGCANLTGEAKRRGIAEITAGFIKLESTTKEEVLLRLGEPLKAWRGETNFVYADFTKDGIPLGPGIGVPTTQNLFLLLIEFDDNNRVKQFEVKKKSLPGTITTRSNVHHHRRALLEQLSRWVVQVVGSS